MTPRQAARLRTAHQQQGAAMLAGDAQSYAAANARIEHAERRAYKSRQPMADTLRALIAAAH